MYLEFGVYKIAEDYVTKKMVYNLEFNCFGYTLLY